MVRCSLGESDRIRIQGDWARISRGTPHSRPPRFGVKMNWIRSWPVTSPQRNSHPGGLGSDLQGHTALPATTIRRQDELDPKLARPGQRWAPGTTALPAVSAGAASTPQSAAGAALAPGRPCLPDRAAVGPRYHRLARRVRRRRQYPTVRGRRRPGPRRGCWHQLQQRQQRRHRRRPGAWAAPGGDGGNAAADKGGARGCWHQLQQRQQRRHRRRPGAWAAPGGDGGNAADGVEVSVVGPVGERPTATPWCPPASCRAAQRPATRATCQMVSKSALLGPSGKDRRQLRGVRRQVAVLPNVRQLTSGLDPGGCRIHECRAPGPAPASSPSRPP